MVFVYVAAVMLASARGAFKDVREGMSVDYAGGTIQFKPTIEGQEQINQPERCTESLFLPQSLSEGL